MTINARFLVDRTDFTLDVDLQLPAQGVTAIFGPSGSGKTSLLRAIAGLDEYPGGYLSLSDEVWQNDKTFISPHQRAVGYVFQEASLFEHLNVRANLEYALQRAKAHRRDQQRSMSIELAAELFALESIVHRDVAQLSGGERQRVAIARAFCSYPRLLLMDEPLAALDRDAKNTLIPFIESLSVELNIPCLYVSHSIDEVGRLADQLVLMNNGAVVAHGDIQNMLTRLDLALAHDEHAESIVHATVIEHDRLYGLTYLDSVAGRFSIVGNHHKVGSVVRLRIAARDVSLALSPQSDASILNVFEATISEISPRGDAQADIRLNVGGIPLLARITRKSVDTLRLEIGKTVYAQAKSIALL